MTCSTCRSVEYTCRPACDPNNQKVEMAFCGKVASQTTCGLALYAFSREECLRKISVLGLSMCFSVCVNTHTHMYTACNKRGHICKLYRVFKNCPEKLVLYLKVCALLGGVFVYASPKGSWARDHAHLDF